MTVFYFAPCLHQIDGIYAELTQDFSMKFINKLQMRTFSKILLDTPGSKPNLFVFISKESNCRNTSSPSPNISGPSVRLCTFFMITCRFCIVSSSLATISRTSWTSPSLMGIRVGFLRIILNSENVNIIYVDQRESIDLRLERLKLQWGAIVALCNIHKQEQIEDDCAAANAVYRCKT